MIQLQYGDDAAPTKAILKEPGQPATLRAFGTQMIGYRTLAELTDLSIFKGLGSLWLLWALALVPTFFFGSTIHWVLLGVVAFGLAVVCVLVIRWWLSYRDGDRRVIHSLLARPRVVAQQRQVARLAGERKYRKQAKSMRPAFTARAKASRAYALVPQVLPGQLLATLEGLEARGVSVGDAEALEAAVALGRGHERVAVAWRAP